MKKNEMFFANTVENKPDNSEANFMKVIAKKFSKLGYQRENVKILVFMTKGVTRGYQFKLGWDAETSSA